MKVNDVTSCHYIARNEGLSFDRSFDFAFYNGYSNISPLMSIVFPCDLCILSTVPNISDANVCLYDSNDLISVIHAKSFFFFFIFKFFDNDNSKRHFFVHVKDNKITFTENIMLSSHILYRKINFYFKCEYFRHRTWRFFICLRRQRRRWRREW